MASPLYYLEDMNVKWDGARDDEAGTYLNTATVDYAVKDMAGATVTGGTGTLTYVTASDGDYLGVINSTITVTPGRFYVCEVTLVQGNYNGKRYINLLCVKRGGE